MRLLMVHFTINRIKVVVTSCVRRFIVHKGDGYEESKIVFSPFVGRHSSRISPSFKDNHLLENLLLSAKVRFLIQAAKRKIKRVRYTGNSLLLCTRMKKKPSPSVFLKHHLSNSICRFGRIFNKHEINAFQLSCDSTAATAPIE